MQRSCRQTRGIALLIVTSLFVMHPVVEGMHHLIQPHFYCLEHSSFEHLLDHVGGGETASRDNAVSNAGLFSQSEDEHILCPISNQAQTQGRFAVAVSTSAVMCCELAAVSSQELRCPSVPLLSYAPKLSPPHSPRALLV
jgi:hypothetical protein